MRRMRKKERRGYTYMENEYVIEMLNITKEFPGIKANDNITLQLRKGEIHALLGENGAGKSTLMSILFGLYQPTSGTIKKNGQVVQINTPNDANDLNIGMVHQHFKLVECFSVLDNIILVNGEAYISAHHHLGEFFLRRIRDVNRSNVLSFS